MLDSLNYYAMMDGAYKAMSDKDREELHEWERQNLGGSVSTSDWPDWLRILGRLFPEPKRKTENREGYVYLFHCSGRYKIGYSKRPIGRSADIGTIVPFDIDVIHTIRSHDARSLERTLQDRFSNKRIAGEWFNLSNEDIDYIINIGDYYE